MSKILIIGGDGYIGKALHQVLIKQGYGVVSSQRKDTSLSNYLDLSSPLANKALLSQSYFAVIILAAMTNIEQCRKFPQQAQTINVDNTLELLRFFSQRNIFSIFFSTNQVFSCQQANAHWQTPYQPCSFYGKLKAKVEQAIHKEALNVAIIRPTKVIGVNFPLFMQWHQALVAGSEVSAFNDLFIAPISLSFLCQQLQALIALQANITVQLSGAEDLSYYQLALIFAEKLQLSSQTIQATLAESKGVEPLPYGSLTPCFGANIADSNKIDKELISSVIEDFQRGLCA